MSRAMTTPGLPALVRIVIGERSVCAAAKDSRHVSESTLRNWLKGEHTGSIDALSGWLEENGLSLRLVVVRSNAPTFCGIDESKELD